MSKEKELKLPAFPGTIPLFLGNIKLIWRRGTYFRQPVFTWYDYYGVLEKVPRSSPYPIVPMSFLGRNFPQRCNWGAVEVLLFCGTRTHWRNKKAIPHRKTFILRLSWFFLSHLLIYLVATMGPCRCLIYHQTQSPTSALQCQCKTTDCVCFVLETKHLIRR